MNEEKEDKSYDLEDRLIDFAVRIIRMAESLPKTRVGNHNALISIFVTSTRTAKKVKKRIS